MKAKESAPICLHISSFVSYLHAIRFSSESMSVPKWHGCLNAGAVILKWTSLAPASLNCLTILLEVVPLTIESSIKITFLSFIVSEITFNLILTAFSLSSWEGAINDLPIYLFLIKPIPYGIFDSWEYPSAASRPESGTPITTSASIGASLANILPAFCLAACTDTPSIIESGLAKYIY